MELEFISTVSSKGQTTVPKEIRDRLHLSKGQAIRWVLDAEHGTVNVARPEQAVNPFLAALCKYPLPEGVTTEAWMAEIRGVRDPELQNGPGAKIVSFEAYLESPC